MFFWVIMVTFIPILLVLQAEKVVVAKRITRRR